MEFQNNLLHLIYFLASLSFIFGLKMLSHPKTARNGNLIAAAGMTLAIIGTIFLYHHDGKPIGNLIWIVLGIIIGTIIGVVMAKKSTNDLNAPDGLFLQRYGWCLCRIDFYQRV